MVPHAAPLRAALSLRHHPRRLVGQALRVMSAADSFAGGPAAVCDSTVLVSGGGMSGVAAAATLVAAGVDVCLVEQGRGLGGRVATRRVRGHDFTFDHGCQYFAPKPSDPFAAVLASLAEAGVVARWGEGGRLGTLRCDATGRLDLPTYAPHEPEKRAFVGVPSMSAVGRHLALAAAAQPGAGALTVALGTRLAPGSLQPAPGGGWVAGTHAKAEPEALKQTRHRHVIAAGSASSTFNVINPVAAPLAAQAGSVTASPCWALMVAFAVPLSAALLPFDGALVESSAAIAWAARNSSKPGRQSGAAETWVVHATAGWSASRRGLAPEACARELLQQWLACVGVAAEAAPEVLYLESFLWNAAFPLNPLGLPTDTACTMDTATGLGLCGDWCVGPRAGDAWASGAAAARAVLARL